MRLLELVAVAIHDMAADLFASYHPSGMPEQEKDTRIGMISLTALSYRYSEQYPRGVFDVVGYWAEKYIFGGVVVFDRGPNEGAREVSSSDYPAYEMKTEESIG